MHITTSSETKHEVLLAQDLQAILRVGRSTVYKLLESGRIHAIKIGNAYRIPRSSVDEFLNAGISVKEEQL